MTHDDHVDVDPAGEVQGAWLFVASISANSVSATCVSFQPKTAGDLLCKK
jgi:hypothetical protein